MLLSSGSLKSANACAEKTTNLAFASVPLSSMDFRFALVARSLENTVFPETSENIDDKERTSTAEAGNAGQFVTGSSRLPLRIKEAPLAGSTALVAGTDLRYTGSPK